MRLRHLSLFIGNASFFTCWIKLCYYAGAKALPLPASRPNSDSPRLLPLPVHPPRLTHAARGAWGQTQRKRKVAPFRKRGMWYGFDALAWYRKERGVTRCLPPPASHAPGAPSCLAPNAVRNRFRRRRASRERRCELRAVVAEPRAPPLAHARGSPLAHARGPLDARGAEGRGFGRTRSTPGGCVRGRSRRGSERAARPPTRWSRLSASWPTSSACPAPALAAAFRSPPPRSPRLPPVRLLPPFARRRGGGAGLWAQVLCWEDGGGVLGVAARGRVRAVCARLPPRAAIGAGVGRMARALCRHAGAVH